MFRLHVFILTVCSSALLFVGCSKQPEPWEVVHPAKGVVTRNGKPLPGAVITLVPTDSTFPSSVRPSATSREDGTFEIGTYSLSDGAPAATYKVVVLHYPVVGSKENPSAGPNDLPKKYSRPETTDLTVTVTADKPDLPPLEIR